MRRFWYLGLAAAVVLALLAYTLLDVGRPDRGPGGGSEMAPPSSIPIAHRADPPSAPKDASAALERLRGELASLRREVADLKQALAALSEAVGRTPTDEGDGEEAQAEEPPRVEDMLAEEARIRSEELTTQDNAFRQETVDPQWSAATLAVVESVLSDMSISEHVRKLECRAATCRVEIAEQAFGVDGESGPAAAFGTLRQVILALGEALPSMTAFEADNGNSVLFFHRDAGAVP